MNWKQHIKALVILISLIAIQSPKAQSQVLAIDDTFTVIPNFCPQQLDVLANDILSPATSINLINIFGNPLGNVAVSGQQSLVIYCTDSLNFAFDDFSYIVCDTLGQTCDTANVFIIVSTAVDTVWPGDANNDGIANNFDIFPIGLLYGKTGPPRPFQSIIWEAFPGASWPDSTIFGNDDQFADCNGDGIINALDVSAIQQNYGLQHQKASIACQNPSLPELSIRFDRDSIYAGDTVALIISLQNAGQVIQNAYGVAFSLLTSASFAPVNLFQPEFAEYDFSGSWLFDSSQISLFNFYTQDATVNFGMVRRDQFGKSGSGDIGSIIVVIDDNIDGIAQNSIPISILPTDVKVIDVSGIEIPACAKGDTSVGIGLLASSPVLTDQNQISIVPNPVSNILFLENNSSESTAFEIYDLLGNEIISGNLARGQQAQFDVSDLKIGTYLLHFSNYKYSYTKKIIIQNY